MYLLNITNGNNETWAMRIRLLIFPTFMHRSALDAVNEHVPKNRCFTESPESWVNAVGSVGGSHDNDMSSLLQAIHQGEELRHDTPFHLAMSLFSLWSDGINFIYEDD